jgi:Plavaka transposase
VRSRLRRVLETAKNSFGLFRRYHTESLPAHDPEGEVDTSALSDIVDCRSASQNNNPSYGPYPNKSSFLLGEWYWNRGSQKSQQDFKELLGIIGDDDFQPASIRETAWDKVDQKLGVNDWDKEEWIDDDAGWRTSSATISVPFHRLTEKPGARDYTVINFHHRSLVSVIREKISNSKDNAHFHYEPYELLWQPNNEQEGVHVRVHGELYTSPSFIDAHRSVQELPGEPGCHLPRVVVALMFWSDSTHLTNFGNAKLWPLYMFFGNESKYRRSKPSCNLCEHVAYFETVCLALLPHSSLVTGHKTSCRIHSKILQVNMLERRSWTVPSEHTVAENVCMFSGK